MTTLLIHELYGGEILKTSLVAGDHFYNWIDGERLDFTASQFEAPISYADRLSCRAEAFSGISPDEYEALALRFSRAIA